MAQIIDFSSFRESRPMPAVASYDQCELLFFLGVRYERMPETHASSEPTTPTSQGPRRSRKRRA